jgi:hypothetical protein
MLYALLAGVVCLIGGFFLMIDAGIALLPDGATCPQSAKELQPKPQTMKR